jgi:hypothetical protein
MFLGEIKDRRVIFPQPLSLGANQIETAANREMGYEDVDN